ncbi:hypothetical protein JI735_33780 (plasmid) [Paenibacillus sonchi]|uniref:Uncharacterized protein n=1 Tax=Paenibacillus sonchi TaxID=373687 RepID=A0A974PJG8_9BACL|nr:hypothetical protein [Paenibacillus sonchi]QQZ64623.1 hypothetical protein JI735_33780 [Paenibacillus sonchi]
MKPIYVQRQVSDTFVMLNFEITFKGIQKWLSMAGHTMDDAALFRALLMPGNIEPEQQSELLWLILHRYEDVFFQVNACMLDDTDDDASSPIHQLMLHMLNKRTLYGEQNTLLDLYLLIQEDRKADDPIYPTLHHMFDQAPAA